MRKKKSEEKHIEENKTVFARALSAATFSVRSNPHLVGLDKIREPVAFCAALKATGYPCEIDGFALASEPRAGEPYKETQEIVDAAYRAALDAAYDAVLPAKEPAT